MRDIQFISVVDDLQVVSVTDVEDASPRTLRVVGLNGFNSTQRVLINDFGIDAFVIVSDTVLLVAPGAMFDALADSQLTVAVVASALTGTRSVRLLFGPTKRVRAVSGLQKLVQTVVKTMLSNTGSNKFNRGEGGDLVRALGVSMNSSGLAKVTALLARAATSTEQQVVAAQARVRSLPSDERLLSLTLGEVAFIEAAAEVRASLKLVSFSGRSVSVPLTL